MTGGEGLAVDNLNFVALIDSLRRDRRLTAIIPEFETTQEQTIDKGGVQVHGVNSERRGGQTIRRGRLSL